MQKDIQQYWQKWNSKFSSKQCTPSAINCVSSDRETADIISDSFSSAYFDSSSLFNVLARNKYIFSCDNTMSRTHKAAELLQLPEHKI